MRLSIRIAQVYAEPWLALISLGLAAGMKVRAFSKFVRERDLFISRPFRSILRYSPGTRYVKGSPVAVEKV
jgi:hypothetical protein